MCVCVCEPRRKPCVSFYICFFFNIIITFFFSPSTTGEPMYEVIKNIPANTELIVHYLPERPEEIFFMPAVHYLRNTLYRRTMDTILEGECFRASYTAAERRREFPRDPEGCIYTYPTRSSNPACLSIEFPVYASDTRARARVCCTTSTPPPRVPGTHADGR